MSIAQDAQIILDKWNTYKGCKVNGDKKMKTFKAHKEMKYDIETAVRKRRRELSLEDILAAIDNYTTILLSRDYFWTYPWTLPQFLSRTVKEHREEIQIYKFIPNNFHTSDWLTHAAKVRNVQKIRRQEPVIPLEPVETPSQRISKMTTEEAFAALSDPNVSPFEQMLIRKLKPEVHNQRAT